MIRFDSAFESTGKCLKVLTQDQIRTLPGLYRADIPFALSKAPLLWDFISGLPVNPFNFRFQSLDVKVTMLKKGWYPCIPGWHCDDFYRPTLGQPDFFNLPEYNSQHYMALYGDSSLTEFVATRNLLLPEVPAEEATAYGFYNREIEKRALPHYTVASEKIYAFDSFTFHRGLPATKDGWRAFVRLTLGHVRPPKNEIRTQVNVYVPHGQLEAGW